MLAIGGVPEKVALRLLRLAGTSGLPLSLGMSRPPLNLDGVRFDSRVGSLAPGTSGEPAPPNAALMLLLLRNGLDVMPSSPAGKVAKPSDTPGQFFSSLVEGAGVFSLESVPRVVTPGALQLSRFPADLEASKSVASAGDLLKDRLELAALRRGRLVTDGELLALPRGLGHDCSVAFSELASGGADTSDSWVALVPLRCDSDDVLGPSKGVAGCALLDD